jgi:NAD(P)-dependent dehydrogenase (short-subunit alcohol dehydrogenase family)
VKRDHTVTWRRTAVDDLDLTGRRVAVVGGTGGIGRALSRTMAGRGASVIAVGRTFRDRDVPGIEFRPADLDLMREAHRVAEELPAEQLELIVLTTGIIAAPAREETAEGIERDMAVSFLSRLVILRQIASRYTGRAFVMGYPGGGQRGDPGDLNAERSYKSMTVHMNTVAGNEMLVLDAANRYPGMRVYGLNPGFIKSDIRANLLGAGSLRHRLLEGVMGLFPGADAYARRITPLLFAPELDRHRGALFDRKGNAVRPSDGMTAEHVARFLTASDKLVARA